MFTYTKRNINGISVAITMVLFFMPVFLSYKIGHSIPIQKQNSCAFQEKEKQWKLEIPKIKLEADIAEDTKPEVLKKFIGHFTETNKEKGNIGFAAHNRGYPVNYFAKLKDLEVGDIIFYYINDKKMIYQVVQKKIIRDTDWTVLKNTNENRITLITCIENKPEYRRCIQGIQIKEETKNENKKGKNYA